jgi:signal recognition particle receptor subunit beta
MPIHDGDAGEIVIRVVYDGPPEAGKTTSLRALAGSLAQTAVTPHEDADGRTLWFDWMEYTGGRYEGCRIRCQIVSVPGQPALAARRRMLLADADVVVCVVDTSPSAWSASADHAVRLCAELATATAPVPGVVVQANKRDLPDAVTLDEVRAQLRRACRAIGVVESIAADGTGIREAFVYAVRLALDRVRELMVTGALPQGTPALDSADALLARMQADERAGTMEPEAAPLPPPPVVFDASDDSVAASLLREVLAHEVASTWPAVGGTGAPSGAPRPPDTSVPSGAIWPPVEGRAILYEVAQHPLVPRRLRSGDWAAGLGTGWRVVSARDATFAGLDHGRAALVHWARLHAACAPMISPRRCIVLADAGDGTWRLWQIVHAEDSLRDLVGLALREPDLDQAVLRICQASQHLLDADRKLAQAPCALACSLDSVGVAESSAVYIGFMPDAGATIDGDPETRASPRMLLRTELAPLVQQHPELHGVLDRVPRQFVHSDTILTTLAGLLRA